MKIDDVKNYIIKNYEDVICKQTYGETSFFYNPNYALKNGVYFCTIKESDGPADKFSNLNRDGVYRISVGITKEKYLEIFEEIPNRPTKGEMIKGDFDFKEKNVIVPRLKNTPTVFQKN